METPPYPLVIERRIAFSQTDAAGLIHFTTYFTLMEEAEAELFRSMDLPLLQEGGGVTTGYPRVDCQCRFRRPLAFDDPVRVELSLEEISAHRLHFRCRFQDAAGKTCASGYMVTAAARRDAGGNLEGTEIPEAVRNALTEWKKQSN